MCAATGAFRTTAAIVVEVETDTLLIQCQLQRTTLITANRIKISPTIEIVKALKVAEKRKYWEIRVSPLYKLEKIMRQEIGDDAYANIEIQVPMVTAPWWKALNTRIAKDAETATKKYNQL